LLAKIPSTVGKLERVMQLRMDVDIRQCDAAERLHVAAHKMKAVANYIAR
jgi:hypothetical protein